MSLSGTTTFSVLPKPVRQHNLLGKLLFMEKLRILLADNHPVVVKGLRSLLETQPGWQVCGEAGDGQEAVTKASELKPDVVVIDVSMSRLNGLEAARRIQRSIPETEVLVLTVHESEE